VLNIQKQTSERSAFSILEGAASKWADHTACIDASGSRSFKQLLDDARAVAGELEALRIPPLAIVGISAASASDFLPSLFGVLAVGAVAMPIAPELSDLEQQRLIRETGVSWRIVENASASPGEQKHSIPGTSLALHQVATSKILTHFAPLFPDAAIIRHTSGTTGPSRGVVLSHRAIEERTITSQQLLGVREGDVILSPLSISYHFIASALTFIRSGATILDATALTPEQAFTLAKNKRASMIYASPETYQELAQVSGAHELSHVRRAVSSSASLQQRTAIAFTNIFKLPITQALGIIEVGLPLWNEQSSCNRSSLGRCMPPFQARVVDDSGNDIEPGEVGELLITGPGIFSGYISSDPTHSYRHTETWFHTGDAVSCESDNTFTYRGRKSSAITLDGRTIFPEEIENAIRECCDVAQVRVRLDHANAGTPRLIAEIVAKDAQPLGSENIQAACRNHLSAHLMPSEWRIVHHIPLTGSGKIVRHNSGPIGDL
jgi:long-chain acyl-CoA synthetase